MHHIPSSGASSAGVMVQAVMERQEIEKKRKKRGKKKKKQNRYLKLLEAWERDQGMHEGGRGIKEEKKIKELVN